MTEKTRGRSIEAALPQTPGYGRLQSAGEMGSLLVTCVRLVFKPPFRWREDVLEECAVAVRRCTFPLVLSTFFFSVGGVITLIAGILDALGTIDRLGAGNIVGWQRETGYWITGMVFAGVVGSAMTADLGARKIREELDAMRVLGVDFYSKLIVPRVVALTLMAPVLGLMAVAVGVGSAGLVSSLLIENATLPAYLDSAKSLANIPDLLSFILRCMVTGLFVGVVCCAKGLGTKGGAEGVGRAVNEAVLITFLGIWILNCIWNAAFLPTFPDVTVLRG